MTEQRVKADGLRVLVVDDEPAIRTMLREALSRAGMSACMAANGIDAVDHLRLNQVDLIVTDLWMPQMNGVELIEYLRSTRNPAKIIVLSAHITESTTDKLGGLGVSAILHKPLDMAEFVRQAERALSASRRDKPAAAGGEAQARVLVADDDPAIRTMLGRMVESAGCSLEMASDGEEAIEKALAYDIDVAIVDINMPKHSGLEVVSAIRQSARKTFVICVSGESGRKEMDEVVRLGAVRCFRKPFDIEELAGELRRLVLVAEHRRKATGVKPKSLPLAARAAEWMSLHRRRYGRRFRWLVLGAVAGVLILAALAPAAANWLVTARRAAAQTAERLDSALDSATRIEGYLHRDEVREVRREF